MKKFVGFFVITLLTAASVSAQSWSTLATSRYSNEIKRLPLDEQPLAKAGYCTTPPSMFSQLQYADAKRMLDADLTLVLIIQANANQITWIEGKRNSLYLNQSAAGVRAYDAYHYATEVVKIDPDRIQLRRNARAQNKSTTLIVVRSRPLAELNRKSDQAIRSIGDLEKKYNKYVKRKDRKDTEQDSSLWSLKIRMATVEGKVDRLEKAGSMKFFTAGMLTSVTTERGSIALGGAALRFEGETSMFQATLTYLAADDSTDYLAVSAEFAPIKLGPVFPYAGVKYVREADPNDNEQWGQYFMVTTGLDISADVGRFKFFGAADYSYTGYRTKNAVSTEWTVSARAGIAFQIK